MTTTKHSGTTVVEAKPRLHTPQEHLDYCQNLVNGIESMLQVTRGMIAKGWTNYENASDGQNLRERERALLRSLSNRSRYLEEAKAKMAALKS
jgi:hypothetical protein